MHTTTTCIHCVNIYSLFILISFFFYKNKTTHLQPSYICPHTYICPVFHMLMCTIEKHIECVRKRKWFKASVCLRRSLMWYSVVCPYIRQLSNRCDNIDASIQIMSESVSFSSHKYRWWTFKSPHHHKEEMHGSQFLPFDVCVCARTLVELIKKII